MELVAFLSVYKVNGQALVKSLRTWASSNGIQQIRVRCSTDRKEAHTFYEELGFALNKKQRVYDLVMT